MAEEGDGKSRLPGLGRGGGRGWGGRGGGRDGIRRQKAREGEREGRRRGRRRTRDHAASDPRYGGRVQRPRSSQGFSRDEAVEPRGVAVSRGTGLDGGRPRRRRPSATRDVDPALDSFRTLYCPRCHLYDCNLHGCGHALPTVKLGEEEAAKPAPSKQGPHGGGTTRGEGGGGVGGGGGAAPRLRATRGRRCRARSAPVRARCWLMDASARGTPRPTRPPAPPPYASTRRGSSATRARPRRPGLRRRGPRRGGHLA